MIKCTILGLGLDSVIKCTLFEDKIGAEELANVQKNKPKTDHTAFKISPF